MNDIDIEKQKLRKKYNTIRDNIKDKKKSQIITNKIIEMEAFKKSKIMAVYKNFKSEVDTTKLIEYAINQGKIVALPKVCGKDLKFYRINTGHDILIKNRFEIEEPVKSEINFIEKNQIDLIIVPGICFDKENNRLGFGKGYYDRYLKDYNGLTIGICFKEQVIDLLPITPNDVKVQKIITD